MSIGDPVKAIVGVGDYIKTKQNKKVFYVISLYYRFVE